MSTIPNKSITLLCGTIVAAVGLSLYLLTSNSNGNGNNNDDKRQDAGRKTKEPNENETLAVSEEKVQTKLEGENPIASSIASSTDKVQDPGTNPSVVEKREVVRADPVSLSKGETKQVESSVEKTVDNKDKEQPSPVIIAEKSITPPDQSETNRSTGFVGEESIVFVPESVQETKVVEATDAPSSPVSKEAWNVVERSNDEKTYEVRGADASKSDSKVSKSVGDENKHPESDVKSSPKTPASSTSEKLSDDNNSTNNPIENTNKNRRNKKKTAMNGSEGPGEATTTTTTTTDEASPESDDHVDSSPDQAVDVGAILRAKASAKNSNKHHISKHKKGSAAAAAAKELKSFQSTTGSKKKKSKTTRQ